jgi:hypothetical protein
MRKIFVGLVSHVLSILIAANTVQAQFTDGARSMATGTGLQYATTGVLAQFTITAIDESGLRRTLGGDDFVVELDGTRTLSGSVSNHGLEESNGQQLIAKAKNCVSKKSIVVM